MITDVCSWDDPGTHRYTGNVPAAIAAYGFPQATQQALVAAFEARRFKDRVVITRDAIRGEQAYEPDIRSMHFGSRGQICGTVTRARWAADHIERALVFCAEGECLAWPSVCGNLFRITPRAAASAGGEGRLPAFISAGGTALNAAFAAAPEAASAAMLLPAPAPAALGDSPTVVGVAAPGSFSEAVWPAAPAPPTGGPVPTQPGTLNPLAFGPQVATPLSATPPAVPEPETWLLWICGLAAVAAAVHRRMR